MLLESLLGRMGLLTGHWEGKSVLFRERMLRP